MRRAALLQISAYGPAFGSAAALAAVVIGLGLSAVGIGGSEMQPVAFNDSLLVGILGRHPPSVSAPVGAFCYLQQKSVGRGTMDQDCRLFLACMGAHVVL